MLLVVITVIIGHADPENEFVGRSGVSTQTSVFLNLCVTRFGEVSSHDEVVKWKNIPRYWPFERGIHRSPVNFPHKSQWRRALTFSLICAGTNGWVNNRGAGDLRHHRAYQKVIVMSHFEIFDQRKCIAKIFSDRRNFERIVSYRQSSDDSHHKEKTVSAL